MKVKGSSSAAQSYPMNGGDDLHSYAKNSSSQRTIIEAAKELITEAIQDNLDIGRTCYNELKPYRIVDLGCSVGQNTLMAVQNIIEAVEKEYQTKNQDPNSLEFQVSFNDHSNNDFNSLFRSFPATLKYYPAGVPGSFYNRLFLKSSLHFVHCSYALHWMSKVPAEVVDSKSPAWSKGSIHYTTSDVVEVYKAYYSQFEKDMESFLNVRAEELVNGGLMVIVMPGFSSQPTMSKTHLFLYFQTIECCLAEMVKLGLINEEKVNDFNIPHYYSTLEELETLIKRNGKFTIQRMGILDMHMNNIRPIEVVFGGLRAAMEGLLKQHFGDEHMDDLFKHFKSKLTKIWETLDSRKVQKHENLFAILKHN